MLMRSARAHELRDALRELLDRKAGMRSARVHELRVVGLGLCVAKSFDAVRTDM